MTTYDVEIGYGSGWVAIVPTGAVVHIFNQTNTNIYYKFGSGGTTNGIVLKPFDNLSANEIIYVKDESHYKTKLTIVGD